MKHLYWTWPGVLALAGAGLWGGCSASGDVDNDGSTKSGGSGAGSPTGSASSGRGGGFVETSASTGVGGGCASSTNLAEKVKLDMYIMLDKSKSMDDSTGSTSKWAATGDALKSFVNLPEASGMGVGIEFFPQPSDGTCNGSCKVDADCPAGCGGCDSLGTCKNSVVGDSCYVPDYVSPTQEIVELPGGSALIVAAINATTPSGATPTSAALHGAIDHAKEWMAKTPGHVAIVTFATDGDPSECEQNLPSIYAIAAAGFNDAPSVRTYVIGVGLKTDTLNNIALHGGTKQAYLVDADAMATQKLIDALKDIQGTALGCVYTIPEPAAGEKPDFGTVNVRYTPGSGAMPVTIPKVKDKAGCTADGNTWYYDNDAAPTQIILCDAMCSAITGDVMGKVDIVLGCTTVAK